MTASTIQVFYNNFTETTDSGVQKVKVCRIGSTDIYITPGSYCAQTLAAATHAAIQAAGLTAWTFELTAPDSAHGNARYRLYTSGSALAIIFYKELEAIISGGYAATVTDTGSNMLQDPLTIRLPFGLHEEYPTYYSQNDILVTDSGITRGHMMGYRSFATAMSGFKFEILSDVESSYADSLDSVDNIGGTFASVVGAINSGAKARLYRNWKGDLTAFHVDTNRDGFTDFVIREPGGISYPFANKTTRRFKVELDVLETS